MGGPNAWSIGRAIAFITVVALHMGLLIILTVTLRIGIRRSTPENFTTTFNFLHRHPARCSPESHRLMASAFPYRRLSESPFPRLGLGFGAMRTHQSTGTLRLDELLGAVTSNPQVQEFGQTPQSPSWQGPTQSLPKHLFG